jgi:hypothetical protein
MKLITRLSGLLKAITYTIRVMLRPRLKFELPAGIVKLYLGIMIRLLFVVIMILSRCLRIYPHF